MIQHLATLVIIVVSALQLLSAPHNGELFELRQPDGSMVPVRVWGDEFNQRVESPEGYTLVRNRTTGWICYAGLSEDSSELTLSEKIYRPEQPSTDSDSSAHPRKHLRQHRKAYLKKHKATRALLLGVADNAATSGSDQTSPLAPGDDSGIQPFSGGKKVSGNYTGLTILIDFSDKAATVPIDSIEDLVNKRAYTGYKNNGSVRDYYYDVSGGKVDYQNIVVGYYRAAKAKTYYDNGSASFGVRAQELILEALKWLDKEGFDFTQLTTDTKKRILAVNFMYAGSPSQGWSEGLWPHQGNLSGFSADGVSVRKYQITNIGNALTIGAFCHENGHMLFNWPDLYDYGGESAGMGIYCIMCTTDEKNPVPPCAYLRDYSGWDIVTDITNRDQGMTFSLIPNSNKTFIYKNSANSNEMFYIEGRRRINRSKNLPDSGFLILHVDRNGSNDYEQATSSLHYLVSLEQADGKLELEDGINIGKAGDLFRKGYKDSFDDNTSPNAHWWNGNASGLKIANMSGVADTMSFSIGEVSGTTYTITASAGAHGSINPSGKITMTSGGNCTFAIKPDSGYQIDALTIDGQPAVITDTVKIEKIGADKTIDVVFALKSAIGIVAPNDGDILYAGDTVPVAWRSRGVTVQGIDVFYSIDGGKTYTPLQTGIAATDSTVVWVVPNVRSDSCRIKVADTDGTPYSTTGLFSITTKPSIDLVTGPLTIIVEKGTKKQQELLIGNKGLGQLRVTATTAQQIRKVLINELSVGSETDGPDGIELLNCGVDVDISGWELIWEDNQATSGSYIFPDGFIFKGGTTLFFHDDSLKKDGTIYVGHLLQWNLSIALEMAVTITDASGRGVDFVKTIGSADLPPEGTSWSGDGIKLSGAFVYRTGSIDTDSITDWASGPTGTMSKVNELQDTADTPIVTVTPLSALVEQQKSSPCMITVDAANLDVGTFTDMIVVYHNDPGIASPIRIPCLISVTLPAAVKHPRPTVSSTTTVDGPSFAVAPNPAGPEEKIVFRYTPVGDEVRGKIMILDATGTPLYISDIDFSTVSFLHKKPIVFLWDRSSGKEKHFRHQTLIARLVVTKNRGLREIFTAKIGLQ